MEKGIRTVVYPVKDIAKAKALFRELLGVEPTPTRRITAALK